MPQATIPQEYERLIALVEQAELDLQGPGQMEWLDRLDSDYPSLVEVLEWSVKESAQPAELRLLAGLRLAGALQAYWERRDRMLEGREWLESLLAGAELAFLAEERPQAEAIAKALTAAARLAYKQGDLQAAQRLYTRCLERNRALHYPLGIAQALVGLGHIARLQGQYREARACYEEALPIRRTLDDKPGVSSVLFALGRLSMSLGDLDASAVHTQEALSLDREIGDEEGMAFELESAGQIAFLRGNYEEAVANTEAATALYKKLGETANVSEALDTLGLLAMSMGQHELAAGYLQESLTLARQLQAGKEAVAWPLCRLGILAAGQGDTSRARALLTEALSLFKDSDSAQMSRSGLTMCLLGFACQAGAEDRPEIMAELGGAAEAINETCDFVSRGLVQPELDRALATARQALGDEAGVSAWQLGRAIPIDRAIAIALTL